MFKKSTSVCIGDIPPRRPGIADHPKEEIQMLINIWGNVQCLHQRNVKAVEILPHTSQDHQENKQQMLTRLWGKGTLTYCWWAQNWSSPKESKSAQQRWSVCVYCCPAHRNRDGHRHKEVRHRRVQ